MVDIGEVRYVLTLSRVSFLASFAPLQWLMPERCKMLRTVQALALIYWSSFVTGTSQDRFSSAVSSPLLGPAFDK